jgi:hypothetical protein
MNCRIDAFLKLNSFTIKPTLIELVLRFVKKYDYEKITATSTIHFAFILF